MDVNKLENVCREKRLNQERELIVRQQRNYKKILRLQRKIFNARFKQ